jgi:hypothetical protein
VLNVQARTAEQPEHIPHDERAAGDDSAIGSFSLVSGY